MKIGGALLRWTETWARAAKCERIELWGYEGAVDFYEYMGFKRVEAEWRALTGGQRYAIMTKPILYNIKISGEPPELEFR